MIYIKTQKEIELMSKAGRLLAACHKKLATIIQKGISTLEIDRYVEKYILENGAKPEQKGYKGYKYATCTSVNDVICHGIPNNKILEDGDIITVDMVVNLDGWLADSAWSYRVGKISREAEHLLNTTHECLYLGIQKAVIGNRIGDISCVIQNYAESQGFSVVRYFSGHGIGRQMHEEPEVPHFGKPGRGIRLHEGMVITIEPMLNIGSHKIRTDSDGWTSRTIDGSLSAQYEHTIAITEDGPLILTDQEGV